MFSCSATGALPLDISLKMDSAHVRTTRSLKSVIAVLYKGGNYTCTAVNKFGSDTRVIRVEIDLLGKKMQRLPLGGGHWFAALSAHTI